MIPAQKHAYVERWFQDYAERYLRRSFHRVLLLGDLPERPPGPVLVCLNHSSWWDMLVSFWLSRAVLGWDCYGPMDRRQLARYPVLSRIGVFGVDRQSLQGGREFLEYAGILLAGQQRALWVTSQGAMVSNDRRPVRLYSGIARLACALPEAHVTTAVLDYEFWEDRLPEAFVRFGPVRREEPGTDATALLDKLAATLEQEMDRLDAARRQRDPSLFRELLGGESSLSPVYDLFRRLKAGLRGRPFHPAHGAVKSAPLWGPAAEREKAR